MNENLQNFERLERKLGAQLFKGISTIKSYYFTEGCVCFDGVITSDNDTTILFEIKVRQFDIDKYDSYILQVDKLKNLIKKSEKNNFDRIYYINFFKNETTGLYDFIIFNLSERIKEWKINKPEVQVRWMNAATFKSTTDKIQKEVIMLKYDSKIDGKGNFSAN